MAIDQRCRELLVTAHAAFSAKRTVDTLWQELALNFYPERADFTSTRDEGSEYSDHLYSSIPVLARRELGNLLSAHLRPQGHQWFSMHVDDVDLDEDSEARMFLERMTDVQWRAMYASHTGFIRASKESDHDYVTFGNAVMEVGLNKDRDGLLYRNYHLRDVAWMENVDGQIDCVFRNWQPTVWQLCDMFPETVSNHVKKARRKRPNDPVKCKHMLVPNRLYQDSKRDREYPYYSIMIEEETENTLEKTGVMYFPYVIPRWHTVSGSVYGRSMATAVSLPDGRTMQVVMRTLRESAEKYTDPPMIAITDAIRGDIPLYAGGVTIADMEYDERLGEVLRPISQDHRAYPIGEQVAMALKEDLRHGFFLDRIQLPEVQTRDMTAYEVRQRIEEHIRSQAPLFEPVQKEYNERVCEITFEVMKLAGALPLQHIPQSLRGQSFTYEFKSPLSDAAKQAEAATFVDGFQRILGPILQVDPSQLENVKMTEAVRDALQALGWKEEWFQDIEHVEQAQEQLKAARQQMIQAQMGQQTMLPAQTAADAVNKGADAAAKLGVTKEDIGQMAERVSGGGVAGAT